jgi:hypothetical protein
MSLKNIYMMFLATAYCEFHIRAAISAFQRVTAVHFSNTKGMRSERTDGTHSTTTFRTRAERVPLVAG